MTKLVEMAEKEGLMVRSPDELKADGGNVAEKQYASATIHFLDRDTQTVKAMTYPITRVELNEFVDGEIFEAVRVFVVGDDGRWKEMQ